MNQLPNEPVSKSPQLFKGMRNTLMMFLNSFFKRNRHLSQPTQFVEGDENRTAKGNDSTFVQGDNNTVAIHVIQYSIGKELEPEILKEKTEIEFWISGKLKDKKHKTTLKALEKHLQKISSDFLLTIDDVEEGSLKFILKGSKEGLEQLEKLFNAGELTEVFGVPVENVDFVESDRKKLALTIAGDISQTDLAKLKATITGVDEKKEPSTQKIVTHPTVNIGIIPVRTIVRRAFEEVSIVFLSIVSLFWEEEKWEVVDKKRVTTIEEKPVATVEELEGLSQSEREKLNKELDRIAKQRCGTLYASIEDQEIQDEILEQAFSNIKLERKPRG
jgi:hypothetical protein